MSKNELEDAASVLFNYKRDLVKLSLSLLEGTNCEDQSIDDFEGSISSRSRRSSTFIDVIDSVEIDTDLSEDTSSGKMSRSQNIVLNDYTNGFSKSTSSLLTSEKKISPIMVRKTNSKEANKENLGNYEIVTNVASKELSSDDDCVFSEKGNKEWRASDSEDDESEVVCNTRFRTSKRCTKLSEIDEREICTRKKSLRNYVHITRSQTNPELTDISENPISTPEKMIASPSNTPPRTSQAHKTCTLKTRKSSTHRKKPLATDSDKEDEIFRTPTKKSKSMQGPSTPVTPRTPKTRVKNLPTILPRRLSTLCSPMTPKAKALIALHTSSVPDSLPCRENEFKVIYSFAHDSIKNVTGGYMYIYGMPGVGKTATVKRVIEKLRMEKAKNLKSFVLVDINGADLRRPTDVYSKIWYKISDEKVSEKKAQMHLQKKFSQPKAIREKVVVLVIDEFDFLSSKKQNVIYDILEWAMSPKLTVLAIANTMNLLERIKDSPKVRSRENQQLCSIGFSPYTSQQLKSIIADRLKGFDIFAPDAIELLAKKAANKGDARTALNLCRRVLAAVQESPEGKGKISIFRVNEMLRKVHSTPLHMFIRKNLSHHDKLVLRAIRDVLTNTGAPSCSVDEGIYQQYKALSTLESNVAPLSEMNLLLRIRSLRKYGLVKTPGDRLNINTAVSLHIEPEDVHLALMSAEYE